jgi:hypothetical protein
LDDVNSRISFTRAQFPPFCIIFVILLPNAEIRNEIFLPAEVKTTDWDMKKGVFHERPFRRLIDKELEVQADRQFLHRDGVLPFGT